MENRNISRKDVEEVRKVKSSQKGSFHNRIYLINVEQDNMDEREEKEQKKQWRKNNPYLSFMDEINDNNLSC